MTPLKAIKPDPAKPLHEMEMHEIVGRKFEKQQLTPPQFDVASKREIEYGSLKGWLKKLAGK